MSAATSLFLQELSSDVEYELRAKNIYHFIQEERSNRDKIVVAVYENERWHPLLKTWGSVVGVHMHPVVDRFPLSDETGTYRR